VVALGVGFDVFTVAMNTGTGNQALTGSCRGKTPKAAIVFATRATALGAPVLGAMISVGMTDGTNHRMSSAMSEDGNLAAVADTGRRVSDAALIQTLGTADETLVGSATFVSFSADTLTINVGAAPATAVLLEVWLFYGDDLQAAVGTLAASATVDTEVTASGLAFRPRVLFGLGGIGGFTPASAAASRITFGYGSINTDGTVQGQAGCVWYDRDRPSTATANGLGHRSDSFLQRITVAGTTVTEEARYEITGGTSDGFKVTTRAGSLGINIGYLALYTATSRAWVGVPTIATSATGNKSITSPGWRPQVLFGIGTTLLANNTYAATTESLHIAFGCATASASFSVCYAAAQNAPTSGTRSRTNSGLLEVQTDGSGLDWGSTLVGFTATGFDINIGTASIADRVASFMAIEESPLATSDTEQISDSSAIGVGLATSETEQITDSSAFNVGLAKSDTEQISDLSALNVGLALSETEQISDQTAINLALALSETEQITDLTTFNVALSLSETEQISDLTAFNVALALSETEQISDLSVVFLNAFLSVSDTEKITDFAVLVTAAAGANVDLVVSDLEEILETVILAGDARVVISEVEQLTDSDFIFLGRVIISTETETITDRLSTPLTTTSEKAAPRAATFQGGAEAGWTYQGGAERGRSVDG